MISPMLPNKITFLSFLVNSKHTNIDTCKFNVKIYFFLMSRGYKALNNYSERQYFKFPGVA